MDLNNIRDTYICYIDLEGQGSNIVEIGAVAIEYNTRCEKVFHTIINPTVLNKKQYVLEAKNSHCIPLSIIYEKGLNYINAKQQLKEFFLSLGDNILIKGNGSDISRTSMEQLFPDINFDKYTFQQVHLPTWTLRIGEYHDRAYTLKYQNKLCGLKNHTMKFSPTWLYKTKSHTSARLARFSYGHHCALIDAYELAFYENEL